MSDASGHIFTIAEVRRLFGGTDCGSAIGRCLFRATTDPGQYGETPEATEVARVDLDFDPTAPPISYPVTVAPSSRITTALTSSPWLSWGTPITAASETSGWVIRTSSISRGYTL